MLLERYEISAEIQGIWTKNNENYFFKASHIQPFNLTDESYMGRHYLPMTSSFVREGELG